ncbi:MAG: thiamine pyrophosphate-dependent dehydrogenase E1 component subunit alpha [Saccharofermentanales bacterium]
MDKQFENKAAVLINKEEAFYLYRKMVEIRKFEEKLFYLFSTRMMPGSMHQYNGEEAVAVGVCANLDKDDFITSTHRGHGHCIAKGADINAVMAEMFAKKTGCCKGMGGSMHISDFSVGMLGANGIVGAGIPQAAGAAWTCKYKKNGHVAVAFFGDGASNEGAFHEGINLAAVWKLPVVFVCENNLYGFSTHYKRTTTISDIADRAAAYGIPGVVADGMDVLDVYEKTRIAVERAKRGDGPTLIECKTYRYMGHSRFEKPTYRTQEEVDEWKQNDPINNFIAYIKKHYGSAGDAGSAGSTGSAGSAGNTIDSELSGIDAEVDMLIDNAVVFAEQSADTDPLDYQKYIFA